jgi:Helix-turn-helix domain
VDRAPTGPGRRHRRWRRRAFGSGRDATRRFPTQPECRRRWFAPNGSASSGFTSIRPFPGTQPQCPNALASCCGRWPAERAQDAGVTSRQGGGGRSGRQSWVATGGGQPRSWRDDTLSRTRRRPLQADDSGSLRDFIAGEPIEAFVQCCCRHSPTRPNTWRNKMPDETNERLAALHAGSDYLTDPQLAKYLYVTTRTTGRWRDDGSGPPFVRVGKRRILYRRADVLAWAAGRTFPHRAAESVAPPVPLMSPALPDKRPRGAPAARRPQAHRTPAALIPAVMS